MCEVHGYKFAYMLVQFPLFPALPAVEMPLAALLVTFQFENTYPRKINCRNSRTESPNTEMVGTSRFFGIHGLLMAQSH